MAFVDVSINMGELSGAKVIGFADRLVTLARNTASTGPAKMAEDDVFCAKRLRAGRLPPIQSCQTSIFRELRNREEQLAKSAAQPCEGTSEPRRAGLKARIGRLFTAH